VISVIFSSRIHQTVQNFNGRHILLIMTRDDIQLYSWIPERYDVKDLEAISGEVEVDASLKEGQSLKDMYYRDLYIPLKSVTDAAIQSFFFTPGLHFDGQKISFIRQMPMFDTQTVGDADIVTVDAGTGKIVQNVHINQKIRKLLAIGERFAVILLPFVDSKYKNLAVVDLMQREVIGGCTVPHSRASTPDFSQISIGDISWLDGFSEISTKGLVACLALADSSIQTITWSSDDIENETSCDKQDKLVRSGSKW